MASPLFTLDLIQHLSCIKLTNKKNYHIDDLQEWQVFQTIKQQREQSWHQDLPLSPQSLYPNCIPPAKLKSIELFAGGGGLALGLELAGIHAQLLNEIHPKTCQTLKQNRKEWQVSCLDVKDLHLNDNEYIDIDVLSGGFPCQAFSYSGKKMGFSDTRGTLFFEFARLVQECQPKIWLMENVKGLLHHDKGRTLKLIEQVIQEMGYVLVLKQVLPAVLYAVPQKRERLFLVAVREDYYQESMKSLFVPMAQRCFTVRDALCHGLLYHDHAPISSGMKYSPRKQEIFALIPQGGNWKNLPEDLQKSYLGNSFASGGGKTGIARRLSWDEASLTLMCSPSQNQTERCHPVENRPLTVREYARIQTFPDEWQFSGSMSHQYLQIGNAVPVHLAYHVGRYVVQLAQQENFGVVKQR